MKFAQRHIGPSDDDQAQMLKTIGYGSLDELTSAALPAGLGGTDVTRCELHGSLPGRAARPRAGGVGLPLCRLATASSRVRTPPGPGA